MSYFRISAAVALLGCLTATAFPTTSVHAADLWGRHEQGSIKDAPVEPAFTWRGFYVGGHAGLATGETTGQLEIPDRMRGDDIALIQVQNGLQGAIANLLSSDYNLTGALYGGHVGFNHQMGNLVLGIEGTYSFADIDGDATCAVIFTCRREIDWLATAEGRIGYAFGHSMVYARGGVAWGDVNTNVDLLGLGIVTLDGGETHTGWTVGFGFEHAISNNIIARVEYSHVDLGEETHRLGLDVFGNPTGVTVPSKVDVELDTIKVGVSVKFGS